MSDIKLNFESKSSLEDSIQKLAEAVAYHGVLKINSRTYQVTDFEFYINSQSADTTDPHTYNHDLQKQYGKIYDHKSGLDLTFGDGINAVGMLIRGMVELNTDTSEARRNGIDWQEAYFVKAHFPSPHVARTELISNLVFGENNLSFEYYNGDEGGHPRQDFELVRTSRVNLTTKPEDPDHIYIDKPLRYVSLIPKFMKTNDGKYVPNGNPMKLKNIEAILKIALADERLAFSPDCIPLFIDYKLK